MGLEVFQCLILRIIMTTCWCFVFIRTSSTIIISLWSWIIYQRKCSMSLMLLKIRSLQKRAIKSLEVYSNHNRKLTKMVTKKNRLGFSISKSLVLRTTKFLMPVYRCYVKVAWKVTRLLNNLTSVKTTYHATACQALVKW